MSPIIHRLLVPSLLALSVAACGDDEEVAPVAPPAADPAAFEAELAGAWELERPAAFESPAGVVYRQEVVFFEAGRNRIEATFYADEALTMPLFIYASVGPYVIQRPSSALAGAWEVDLTNDGQTLTMLVDDPDLIAAVGWDDCGLEVNTAVDVTNGCAAPPLPPADCEEQDVWRITDDGGDLLEWGDTSVDRCATRPTAFDPIGLRRR